jgi:hypothetical protein
MQAASGFSVTKNLQITLKHFATIAQKCFGQEGKEVVSTSSMERRLWGGPGCGGYGPLLKGRRRNHVNSRW